VLQETLLRRCSVTETFCMETFSRGDVLCGDVLYVQYIFLFLTEALLAFLEVPSDVRAPSKCVCFTFFRINFVSLCFFRFVRFRFASDFKCFALKRNKRKNGFFASNRKRTAHPSDNRAENIIEMSWNSPS
jgi:hypothetical protein